MSSEEERLQKLNAKFEGAYNELRRIAAWQQKNFWESSLSATELVGELYLRLYGAEDRSPEALVEFKRYAGKAFRNILIDRVRKKKDRLRVTLTAGKAQAPAVTVEVMDLHRCLEKMEALPDPSPSWAAVVEMSSFSGMTTVEMAQALDVSTATIDRYKKRGHAWLSTCLKRGDAHELSS